MHSPCPSSGISQQRAELRAFFAKLHTEGMVYAAVVHHVHSSRYYTDAVCFRQRKKMRSPRSTAVDDGDRRIKFTPKLDRLVPFDYILFLKFLKPSYRHDLDCPRTVFTVYANMKFENFH